MGSDKIRIDTDKLDDISQQLAHLSSSLASISTSIAGMASTAFFVVSEQPAIVRNIYSLKNRVSASSLYAKKLSGAVRSASAQWAATESKVAEQQIENGDDPFGSSGGGEGKGKNFWDYALSLLQKAIGGTGIIGKIVKAVWSGFEKGDAKNWMKSGVDILGSIGKAVLEGRKGTEANWGKALFGIGEYGKKAGEAFQKGLTNPISWTTNGVKSAIDNWEYAQQGNIPRFLSETVAETGTNVLLGAGGAALAAALLGPSAPALLVGAAGAGIVWGVNEVVKWISGGKGVAEIVGDVVGDVTDWAVEKVGQAADWVADKGKQIFDTGSKILADAGETVCKWFSWAF